MANVKEDILVVPERGILEFGNGYSALIFEAVETEDNSGNDVVKFMIQPSELLRKRYSISDDMLNKNRQMPYMVKRIDLIFINILDDSNRKVMYVYSFDHKETAISKLSQDLRIRLEEEIRMRKILEGQVIFYADQFSLSKNNPVEFMAQPMELFDKINSRALEFYNKKEEKWFH